MSPLVVAPDTVPLEAPIALDEAAITIKAREGYLLATDAQIALDAARTLPGFEKVKAAYDQKFGGGEA